MTERRTVVAVCAALVASAALLGAEFQRGALHLGETAPADPCTQRAPIAGGSFDAKLQRIALDGIARAACRLGTTRAELALALDSPAERSRLAQGRDLEEILRQSLVQAVDEQRDAGNLNAGEAFLARQLVQNAPVSWLRGVLSIA